MKRVSFVVHDTNGKILRTGKCLARDLPRQSKAGETVIEGKADDAKQKIVSGKVVAKTQAEIDADKPPQVKPDDMPAHITNKQWQDMQDRITQLENN